MSDFVDRPSQTSEKVYGLSVRTDRSNSVPVISIEGEITSKQQLIGTYTELLQRNMVLEEPDKYLLRNVRKSKTEQIFSGGCERNGTSYRDKQLEKDFNLKPDDYTYCNSFEGDINEFLRHAIYNPSGTDLVVYHSDMMIPHHEEKCDRASSLGQGPTAVTYEFKNKDRKVEAVKLIIKANFRNLDDLLWQ